MKRQILPLSLVLLFFVFCSTSFAQHKVLFETFTNSYDLCPSPNTFDPIMKSTATSKASKIIHLNHHVANLGDIMAQAGVGVSETDLRLGGLSQGDAYPVFTGAVNRVSLSSGRLSNDQSEWNSTIDNEASQPADVTIALVNATYDKAQRLLHAQIEYTVVNQMTEPVNAFYAFTEDKVSYKQCGGTGPSLHNEVTRYITLRGIPIALMNKPAGTKIRDDFQYHFPTSQTSFKFKDMRFIAFVEVGDDQDYHVANAAVLATNLDALPAPVATLELDESNLSGKTFSPGDIVPVNFTKENVQFVRVSFSSNGGESWMFTGLTSSSSPVNWTVPDTGTSTGKLMVYQYSPPDSGIISIQSSTFSISPKQHSLTILHPLSKDTMLITRHFDIQWNGVGVGPIKIEVSRNGGTKWDSLGTVTDGSGHFDWLVTAPATATAEIRLTSIEPLLTTTSDLFTIDNPSSQSVAPKGDAIALGSIYPNPVRAGKDAKLAIEVNSVSEYSAEIYDMVGRLIQPATNGKTMAGRIELDVSKLTPGTYTVLLKSHAGVTGTLGFTVIQ